MRQSGRDGVRGITETHVNHHGMQGVKERNRVKEGEKEGGSSARRRRRRGRGARRKKMKTSSEHAAAEEEEDSRAAFRRRVHVCKLLCHAEPEIECFPPETARLITPAQLRFAGREI